MKKTELVLKEILYQAMESKNMELSQSYLAKALNVSLSTVNLAISPLKRMGAVKVMSMGLKIINPKKILMYWASMRNMEKDMIAKVRVELPASEIEKSMPSGVVYGSYSAYKFLYNDQPADYSEVYVYTEENDVEKITDRFRIIKGQPNLFIMKKDFDKMTLAHIFVDLWNLKEWYAKEFLKSMEEKIHGILE